MALPRITVVGLGPGSPAHVTSEALAAIDEHRVRFLRTARHPSAVLVPDALSFDDAYESADTFDDVYAAIAERLVAAALEHGTVLYAVPGSPLVLERTVRTLRADERIECRILPAISFLDVVWARLGIDPVEERVTLVDGHRFAEAVGSLEGPLLIAHAHANWVMSDIKLAVDSDEVDDLPVVILQRLGTDEENIVHTTWSELDRAVEADHLTSVFVPRLAVGAATELGRFHLLARTLRERCPWDQEQTHESLVKYLLEETYEVVDALRALDPADSSTDEALVEELGDLLYQIEFHATIAEEQGRFTMADVARGVHDKLVRRHPHVFGEVEVGGADEVVTNWEEIKRAEKHRTSVFEGVPTSQPALSYAAAVQKKASRVGFDWPDVTGALPKIAEEAAELADAVTAGRPADVRDELGDLLFAVVNVARHLDVEPETALRQAVAKFRTRFEGVETLARERGIDLHTCGLVVLDGLWDEVKAGTVY